ncbi:MAG: hypothetical protein AAF600_13125 [Bacteroidota bacterium]
MEVKIYREPENEQIIIDEDSLKEYHELTNKLGLNNEVKEKVPSVYIPINTAMSKLLKALCPNSDKVEEYNKSTIPVEVLRVLDFAKENEMYEGFQVWHAQNDPDPLLIGWKYLNDNDRKNGYDWNRKYYLMARWGDCAMELEDLLKKGFDVLKTSLIDSTKEVESYCKSVLSDPDGFVRKHLKSNLRPPSIDIESTSGLGTLPF